MKFIKKVTVYLLVGFLCCSSVVTSYDKAESSEAASIGVGIGLGVITVALALYGCYYVSQPENRESIKESMTNYAAMTITNAKLCYETNKKLFEDFCEYASANGGGSSAVYTVGGQTFAINAMKEHGFPSFEEWDEEMKKQGSPASGGSIWDKLSFGLDLLGCIRDFFNDDESFSGSGQEQSYYTGDDGYYNSETGYFSPFVHTTYYSGFSWVDNICEYGDYIHDYWAISGYVGEKYRENFRIAMYVKGSVGYEFPLNGDSYDNPDYVIVKGGYMLCTSESLSSTSGKVTGLKSSCYTVYNGTSKSYGYSSRAYNTYNMHYLDGEDGIRLDSYIFLSSNIPIFPDYDSCSNYILTGDASAAINLPPTSASVTPSAGGDDSSVTPVQIYCNNLKGRSVTPSDIVNINYNIVNNWDGTTENLTIILQGDDDNSVTAVPTVSPIPTLADEDGSNTTNNYIINITNILQPIQTTVTNIYNFFIIDTETISEELNNINTVPVTKFENVVKRVNVLRHIFSDEPHENIVQTGDSTVYGIYYPVIKMKCHSALLPYLNVDELLDVDGVKYIVLLDFKDWAVVLVRVRGFMKIALWVGMIFWVMKQVRVVITIS